MVAETRVRRSPEFEAAQESYIDLLTQQVGRAPGTAGIPTLAQLGPQVAGVDPLTQAAQQRAATQAGLGQLTFTPEGKSGAPSLLSLILLTLICDIVQLRSFIHLNSKTACLTRSYITFPLSTRYLSW